MDSLEQRTLLAAATLQDGFAESLVADGLVSPTAMAFAPDGRLFVAEKGGDLRVIKNGALLATPFASISTDTFGERGLGGITFDPDFANNHFVYIYYTAQTPVIHNRLSRVTASGDVAIPGSEQVLLDLPPMPSESAIHNGGALQFAPDGTLYVAVGEQGSNNTVQSMDHPFGKILRLNSDGTIPTDNPFYNTTTGVNRAIWATGLRNPFTTAFQPGTGRFYINDVGQDAWEEINQGAPGANYGWTVTEGPFDPIQYPAFTNPLYAYEHPEGYAVTGGVFYNPTSAQFPSEFVGEYFFADYAIGFIRHMNPETFLVSEFATGAGYPVDLDVSADGALYYLSRLNSAVYKITASQAPAIVGDPISQTIHTGDPATFTVSASGQAPLTYQWQRNGVDIPGATAISYTIAVTSLADDDDTFRCVVSNAQSSVTSNSATLNVTDDTPPAPAIAASSTYHAGQTITFTGGAFDIEDGSIPASNMTWEVIFHHNTHTHPHVAPFSGATGGSFVIPTVGETAANVWYRIHLTVTDSAGFVRSTYKDITPQTAQITVGTNVPGLSTSVDGQPHTGALAITGVRGMTRVLTALPTQVLNGVTYEFVSWSDGGSATHPITFPNSATTYTATYAPATIDYVSDIEFASTVGFPRRDSNSANAPITIDGVAYAKGIGLVGSWSAIYNINGIYNQLTARIGADDIIGDGGTMEFQVWGDGVKLFDSGIFTGLTPGQDINVNVSGVQELTLTLTEGGDGFMGDWGAFADAKLHAPTALAPLPPSDFAASAPYYNRVQLSWVDRSSNEQGFQIQRSDDGGASYTAIATVGLGVTSYIDTGRVGGTEYRYRVRAYNSVGLSPNSAAVTVTTPAMTLPPGWQEMDIGATQPVAAGNTSFSDGTFTVRAGGLGIASEADSFHFVYRMLIGNGEIVARVMGISETSQGRDGVMMRESLDPSSRSAFMFLGNAATPGFISRATTGGESNWTFMPVVPYPYYLKLQRQGATITGFSSSDGVEWTQRGTMTMDASAPLYIGLAGTSWYPTLLNSATFDNVSYTNVAPEIGTAASATLNAAKTAAALSARGSDDGGEGGLTYTWEVIDKPLGADDPVFAANGTYGARDTTATFNDLGAYTLRVTISDGQVSVTSDVNVVVDPKLTSIAVTPGTVELLAVVPQQFFAVGLDQFGDALLAQPVFTWSAQGGGSINSSGVYMPVGEASVTVYAAVGAVSGSANIAIDTIGPQTLAITTPAPAPADATWTFNVTFVDVGGIDFATLGNNDVIVIAPDGTEYAAVLLGATPDGNGSPRVATYRIVLNDLCFDSTDNGLWRINLTPGSVLDTHAHGVAGGEIGSFVMEAPFAVVNQLGELIVNGTSEDDELALDTNVEGNLIVTLSSEEIVVDGELVSSVIIRGLEGVDTFNSQAGVGQSVVFHGGGQTDVINVDNGTYTLSADMNGMLINVHAGGLLLVDVTQHLATLNILDGTVQISGEGAKIVTDNFGLSQAGCMDINAGALIVHNGELGIWDGGYTGMMGELAYGRQGGSWSANGITSTAAAGTGGLTSLSIARAGDLFGIGSGETEVWRGETVFGDSVLVLYSWSGDVDLNGELTGDDYFAIDSNVLLSGVVFGFRNGDFDLNGEITGDDYFMIDSVILVAQQSGPL